eukprot:COSAG02_NODE_39_length_48074_cov_106.508890_19_plen_385_part_00
MSGYRRQRVRVKALREGTDFGVLHRTSPRGACCWLADGRGGGLAGDGRPAPAGHGAACCWSERGAAGGTAAGYWRKQGWGGAGEKTKLSAALRLCVLCTAETGRPEKLLSALRLLPAACCPLFSAFRLPPSALFTDGGISVCRLPLQVQQAAGKSVGEGGGSLSEGTEAARLAKEWYDARGPLAGDLVLGEVTAAHKNYTDGWDAEWSLRYTVDAAAGSVLPRDAVEPLLQEKYFVRFFYEYDEGKWTCYGLDEHKASANADSGVDLDVKLWAKLVLRCAKALRRASSNLPAYVAETSIQLQLGALGAEEMRKILRLSSKEGDLDEQEKQYVIDTLEVAMRCPSACAVCDTVLIALADLADPVYCASPARCLQRSRARTRRELL